MKVRVIPGGEVVGELAARWSEIQLSSRFLDSPYFCPEYIRATASVLPGVMVAILEREGHVAGFFPFQRGRGKVGHPVGGEMSDFQAVIAPEGAEWDAEELVRGCGLSAWRFDHLLATQQPFRAFHWKEAPSPYLDLARGFDAYRAERKAAGYREIERILYKARKAERRVGPLRFEFHTSDDRAFEALVRWKGEKLRSTGMANRFEVPWVTRFLDRIRHEQHEGFSAVLSTLHMGDRLAAVHLGMRSRSVFHWWLPTYDAELGAHSPGQISFIEVAAAAAARGVRRLDLGKGLEPYKTRLTSEAIPVAEGSIDLRPVGRRFWLNWHRAQDWARSSPLRRPLLKPARWLRRALRSPDPH